MEALEDNLKTIEKEIAKVQAELEDLKVKQKEWEDKRLGGAREAEDFGISLISHRKGLEKQLEKLYEDKAGARTALRVYVEEKDAADQQAKVELQSLELARSLSSAEEMEQKRKQEERARAERESMQLARALSVDGENAKQKKSIAQFQREMSGKQVADLPPKGGDEKKMQEDADIALAMQLEEEEKARRSRQKSKGKVPRNDDDAIPPPAYDNDGIQRGKSKQRRSALEEEDLEGYAGEGEENDHNLMRTLSQLNQVQADEELARRLHRLWTVRDNVDNEKAVEYRPFFTYAMIIINVVVFIVCLGVGNWQFESLAVNPMIGPSATLLLQMGAKWTPYILAGQAWRLFTPMFLHAGIVHLLLNMVMLYRLGTSIESVFGLTCTAIIYLFSGVSGAIASAAFNPSLVGVGASGALYGLVGALFGDFAQNHKTIIEGKWKYFASMVLSLAFGLVIGLLPVIDNWAHLGGLICGFLLGLILLTTDVRDENGKKLKPWYSKIAVIVAAILLFIWTLVMLSILYTSTSGYSACKWCRYLDCVDTSYWSCGS